MHSIKVLFNGYGIIYMCSPGISLAFNVYLQDTCNQIISSLPVVNRPVIAQLMYLVAIRIALFVVALASFRGLLVPVAIAGLLLLLRIESEACRQRQ